MIEINGKKLQTLYGLWAQRRIESKYRATTFEDTQALGTFALLTILYSGYLAWCLYNDKDPEISHTELYDYLDKLSESEGETVLAEIAKYKDSKRVEGNGEATEEEKKSLATTNGIE